MIISWFSILSGLCRIIGLFDLADNYWQKHKFQEARNARDKVNAMSESELDKRVHDDITRK